MGLINILNVAMNVIGSQDVGYQKWIGKEVSADGIEVKTYAPVVTVRGAAQAVTSKVMQQLKLDVNRHYRKFYLPIAVLDLQAPNRADRIVFEGFVWAIIDMNNWYNYNGWVGIVAVREDNIKA